MPATQAEVFERPPVERGWTRAEAPELYKFEKAGDYIVGTLVSVTTIQIDSQDHPGEKQNVTQYIVGGQEGKSIKFLATYDLSQKISKRMIGCMIRVTYLGQDEKVSRGNNRMRVFDVQYKGSLRSAETNSGPITDEDIPF